MCGIVGYAGHRQALDVVVEGLTRLEYRGYDSAGVAVIDEGALISRERAGKLSNLLKTLAEDGPFGGSTGMGHTRWATHGAPTDPNAHPHLDCTGQLAVIHNGIIENFASLRAQAAAAGHVLTQLAACYLVALYLAQIRGVTDRGGVRAVIGQLAQMPAAVQAVLGRAGQVRTLARELAGERCVLFLGRHVGYPVALEGALKLKELAYMHAEGFAAGELKHGPIAPIESGLPVVVVVPSVRSRVLHDKIVSNVQEIRARGARVIAVAEEGDEQVRPYAGTLIEVPAVPACSSRWSPPSRCRSSPANWPPRPATTWTSPATSPNPSRSNSPGRRASRAITGLR